MLESIVILFTTFMLELCLAMMLPRKESKPANAFTYHPLHFKTTRLVWQDRIALRSYR